MSIFYVVPGLSQKEALRKELAAARFRTDELFRLLDDATLYERPVSQRHRLIFYLGHVDAFDWNLIGRRHLNLASLNPALDKLFEFGIDPEPGREPADSPSDWPDLKTVRAYVEDARVRVDYLVDDASLEILETAVEHRLMHAETLAYLLHQLPAELKRGTPERRQAPSTAPPNPMVEIPAGVATLGAPTGTFGWDNEFDRHQVQVPAFRVSRYKVTNGEYLEFVKQGAPTPHFWEKRNGEWHRRGMFGSVLLPLDEPVYVTHAEASAFARWKGMRLMTEAEYHRAAFGTPEGGESAFPWGSREPADVAGNFDFRCWDPQPVNASPDSASAFGVSQLPGNGWEWTSTEFAPFDGFAARAYYPGYSRDFFDGKHYVLKGGSSRTAARLLRRSFRNWFRADYPYAYTAFRCVETA
jgi:gamma-glutamyl hercynylcysteine S-oxide synthase